ncbi:MAG: hypothetical protein O7G86_00485 [Gammaproteobacteria bacterium]|nr:hypothetical protein [Gammaproteobacteria bacterium]
MRPILIGAIVSGILIALVFVIFETDSGDAPGDTRVESSSASNGEPLELPPQNPDPSNPGSDFTGRQSPFDGITRGGIDPQILILQLEMAGVDIPEGASTEELIELLNQAVLDGFTGYAP